MILVAVGPTINPTTHRYANYVVVSVRKEMPATA
jgi:hypothetical protein